MSDDPFEDIDDEREGDPFADLGEEESLFTDEQAGESATDASETSGEAPAPSDPEDRHLAENPFSEMDAPRPEEGETDPFEGMDTTSEDDPFADLGTAPGDGDPFEGMTGGEDIDDSVWEDLSGEAEPLTEESGGRRLSEVSKHSFCEQCPHFTGPPEIACTNEGTEILAFLDMETVRVADCPVVEEREELESAHR